MSKSLEEIFTKERMLESAYKVRRKKSAGVDGISAKRAVEIVENNYSTLFNEIITGKYKPKAVKVIHIPKQGTVAETRPIAIGTACDRIIQNTMVTAIQDEFDKNMSDYSFGFRKERNCIQAVNTLVELIKSGYAYIVKLDMTGCFNHLNHDRILYLLRKVLPAEDMKLINAFLKVELVEQNSRKRNYIGAPQGSALSPLYANLILSVVDIELEKRNHPFIRYADDIYILCRSEKAAIRTLSGITNFIEKKCNLKVNTKKSSICNIDDGVNVLGFRLYQTHADIHIVPSPGRINRIKDKIKTICSAGSNEEIINNLNNTIRGWTNYYSVSEMNQVSKDLDFLIKKQITKAEKRNGSKIDRRLLLSCNNLYSKIRHQHMMETKGTKKKALSADDAGTVNQVQMEETAALLLYRERSPPSSTLTIP